MTFVFGNLNYLGFLIGLEYFIYITLLSFSNFSCQFTNWLKTLTTLFALTMRLSMTSVFEHSN